jgi:hypothetical protein
MDLNHQTRLCRPFPDRLGSAPCNRKLEITAFRVTTACQQNVSARDIDSPTPCDRQGWGTSTPGGKV